MGETAGLRTELEIVMEKAKKYDKFDLDFKIICGKGLNELLTHITKVGLSDSITEQQALNKLAERFPMTTDQIVSTLEMSQAGVNHEPVEVPEFIKNVMQKYKSLQDMLTEEYYSNDTSENDSDAVFCWIDTNFDLLCRAWLDGCTVAKEPLYFWRLNLQSTILYQFAIKRGSSYTLKSGYAIAECAMTEKTAKEVLRKDFDLFKPVEPKLNDGTIIDTVPVEEEAE